MRVLDRAVAVNKADEKTYGKLLSLLLSEDPPNLNKAESTLKKAKRQGFYDDYLIQLEEKLTRLKQKQ